MEEHLTARHEAGHRWEITDVDTALAADDSVEFVFWLEQLDVDGTGVGKGLGAAVGAGATL